MGYRVALLCHGEQNRAMSKTAGNRGAFLDMIAFSEGTARVPNSDDGYKVVVGGGVFASYADHPRLLVEVRPGLKSTAAGRYQLLARYWDAYRVQLHLADFSPASQDAVALQQIRECGALDDIDAGRVSDAIAKCRKIWASFPGAGYGQREEGMGKMLAAYSRAGGTVLA
jgi:muramidase (phage lysozyme)